MKKHSDHRKQVAKIKREMYQELRVAGWSPKAAKLNVNSTIEFMDGIQQLAFAYGCTVTVEKCVDDYEKTNP